MSGTDIEHAPAHLPVNRAENAGENGTQAGRPRPVAATQAPGTALPAETLIVDLEGFEGPLDLLLSLSRAQKVDLLQISVLSLARQYLAFIKRVQASRIELAADYLVMASWLALLKSRLLLPQSHTDPEPDGAHMAAHLAFQLERLAAMRTAAARLMARDRLGVRRFERGMPARVRRTRTIGYRAALLDLMQGYARVRARDTLRPHVFERTGIILSLDEALVRVRARIGQARAGNGWISLSTCVPDEWRQPPARRRSATASTFAATLELARAGVVELRQSAPFTRLDIRDRRQS